MSRFYARYCIFYLSKIVFFYMKLMFCSYFKEFFVTLPYFYRSFITFQVITNQVIGKKLKYSFIPINPICGGRCVYYHPCEWLRPDSNRVNLFQIVFFILSEKVFAPENHLLSLYLLIFFTILMYVKTCLEVSSIIIISTNEF